MQEKGNLNHYQKVLKKNEKSTKVRLSENFYENLIEMENKILYDKSITNINELISMYKQGTEFSSGTSSEKQKFYMDKIKELFMD